MYVHSLFPYFNVLIIYLYTYTYILSLSFHFLYFPSFHWAVFLGHCGSLLLSRISWLDMPVAVKYVQVRVDWLSHTHADDMSHMVTRCPTRRLAWRLNLVACSGAAIWCPTFTTTTTTTAWVSCHLIGSAEHMRLTLACLMDGFSLHSYCSVYDRRAGKFEEYESKSEPEPGTIASEVHPGRQDVAGHASLRQTRFFHARHWVATRLRVSDGGLAAWGGSSLCLCSSWTSDKSWEPKLRTYRSKTLSLVNKCTSSLFLVWSLQQSLLPDWKYSKLTSYDKFFWCHDFLPFLFFISLFLTPCKCWYAMKLDITEESSDNKRSRLVGGVEGWYVWWRREGVRYDGLAWGPGRRGVVGYKPWDSSLSVVVLPLPHPGALLPALRPHCLLPESQEPPTRSISSVWEPPRPNPTPCWRFWRWRRSSSWEQVKMKPVHQVPASFTAELSPLPSTSQVQSVWERTLLPLACGTKVSGRITNCVAANVCNVANQPQFEVFNWFNTFLRISPPWQGNAEQWCLNLNI